MDNKVYEIITNQIIELLEKGIVPWHKPWKGMANTPKNLKTKKEYRGINPWILASHGYASPWWVSFNQCKSMGGAVKSGEKGTIIVFWKPVDYKTKDNDGNDTTKKVFILRYYRVWNSEQCEGLKVPTEKEEEKKDFTPIQECERVVSEYNNMVPVNHGGGRAFYSPDRDTIGMPEKETFDGSEEYYSTLFHEIVHSTGHESRLDRDLKNWFASPEYSKEELVAEIGAAYLCGFAGITNTIKNSASYIGGWLKKLRDDKKFIISAAAQAQKACDFILNKTYKEKTDEEAQAE